jgi:hypothetical protein
VDHICDGTGEEEVDDDCDVIGEEEVYDDCDEIREDASYGGSGGGWGIRFLSGVLARDRE